MVDNNEIQWWAYLIGKIKETELSAQNKLRLTQERAVREAQHIVGEIPLKPWHIVARVMGIDDDE